MTLKIHDCNVARVLIVCGSSADIIFYAAFDSLLLNDTMIKLSSISLIGFEGSSIKPKGSVTLEVTTVVKSLNVEFLIVQTRSAYSAIFDRNWIHKMEGIPFMLHQVIKCLSMDDRNVVETRGRLDHGSRLL